jgi:tetrahydromethanopterin S-methyltransferase subunit B
VSHDPVNVVIVAHPPERRRQRSGAPAQAGQCCCCCCCCLHTLGGLIGSAVAPTVGAARRSEAQRSAEAADYADDYWDPRRTPPPGPERAGLSAVALYWLTTAALCVIGTSIAALLAAAGDGSELVVWGFLLLMFFPALQLIAAIPPAGYFLFTRRPDRGFEFMQLARILIGLVVGTMIGIAIMALIGIVLRVL